MKALEREEKKAIRDKKIKSKKSGVGFEEQKRKSRGKKRGRHWVGVRELLKEKKKV